MNRRQTDFVKDEWNNQKTNVPSSQYASNHASSDGLRPIYGLPNNVHSSEAHFPQICNAETPRTNPQCNDSFSIPTSCPTVYFPSNQDAIYPPRVTYPLHSKPTANGEPQLPFTSQFPQNSGCIRFPDNNSDNHRSDISFQIVNTGLKQRSAQISVPVMSEMPRNHPVPRLPNYVGAHNIRFPGPSSGSSVAPIEIRLLENKVYNPTMSKQLDSTRLSFPNASCKTDFLGQVPPPVSNMANYTTQMVPPVSNSFPFTGQMVPPVSNPSNFMGQMIPSVSNPSTFAGQMVPPISNSSTFAGQMVPPVSNSSTFAGQMVPPVSNSSTFAGQMVPPVSNSSTFTGQMVSHVTNKPIFTMQMPPPITNKPDFAKHPPPPVSGLSVQPSLPHLNSSDLPRQPPVQLSPVSSQLNLSCPPPSSFLVNRPHFLNQPPPAIVSKLNETPLSLQSISPNPLMAPVDPAQEDECKLTKFLQRFSSNQKRNETSGISIAEFRARLKKALFIINELTACRDRISNFLLDENDWKTETKKCFQYKEQLIYECDFVSAPVNLTHIQAKLKARKRKRGSKWNIKQNKLKQKTEKLKNREELHQEIDKWLDSIKEKNLKLKREAEMKKEADSILSEVRRKIQVAKRMVEKIKIFEKLRSARQATAVQKGLILPDHDKTFQRKNLELKNTMLKQLKDYESEEKALKVMLEAEQEGQLEEEALWRIKKLKTFQQRRQNNIIESLFGITEEPADDEAMFLFYQFHNSGNKSIESLIHIRHQWDIHINDVGEAISPYWVVPVPPSNESWEGTLKSR